MKIYAKSLLSCLIACSLLFTVSGCQNDDEETLEDAWINLMNSIDLTGGGPKGPSVPTFDNMPSIVIDSTSTNGSDAITLWIAVSCNADGTLILNEINVGYREVEDALFTNENFLAGPDTLTFVKGLQQSYLVNVEVDSLMAHTKYRFCASAKYIFNEVSTSSFPGCREAETKE